MIARRVIDGRIDWAPAGWLTWVVTAVVVAAVGAIAAGRFDLVVFAAPLLGALAGAWWSARPRRPVRLSAAASAARVFEGETVELAVELTVPPATELIDAELRTGEGVVAEPLEGLAPSRDGSGPLHGRWVLHATRWGRSNPRLTLTLRGAGGLLVGQARCAVTDLAVFPSAERISRVPRPMDLPDLLGMHLGRRTGDGVEFAGIRAYQPGDPLRSVNWAVTARRGGLHVTERLAEQAARVVTVIDAAADVRQPGPSTLGLSVHGALAVTGAALRRGDLAGVMALGGTIRWLAPGLGRRHFYQVVEALLEVPPGSGSASWDGRAFPRTLLPPGSAVVVFSPLLDDRMVNALAELRRRGVGLVVIDVLRAEPRPREAADYDPLAIRMWRLRREGMRYRLAEWGVPVGTWSEGVELDEVLGPMSRRPLWGRR